ncbi:hypothetical protein [Rhodococcus opacus]|uniref:hypothetical protein n=1 Tax=Rhodococcus opacus TaxID=37919 RepID=UPI001C451924|nr:hypothetical protein [Rhodococcus opacus]MBV6758361.1 hypothetical protein [Rhodococcus opacus]
MPDAAPATVTATDSAATAPADAGTSAPATPVEPAAPVIPAAPASAPADPAAPAGDPAGTEPTTFDASYVKGLRTENANWRTKHHAAETAHSEIEQKYNDLVASLGKLGGFTPAEGTDAPADPADAIAAAEQRANDMAAQLADYTMRDAVRNAGADADVPALLDSTSFLAEVGQIDHSATDYAAQVAAAVESFVSANPRFASAPVVPGRSGGDTSAGDGEPGQLTREQFDALTPADRIKAFADGRFKP